MAGCQTGKKAKQSWLHSVANLQKNTITNKDREATPRRQT